MGCCNETTFNLPRGESITVDGYSIMPNGDTKVTTSDGAFFIVKKGSSITIIQTGTALSGNTFVKFSDNTIIEIPKGLRGEDSIYLNINPQVANDEFFLNYDFDYSVRVIKANNVTLESFSLPLAGVVYTGTANDIVKIVVSKTGPAPVLTLKVVKI